jgi:beta-galactosidase
MKKTFTIIIILFSILNLKGQNKSASISSFDSDWKFHRGNYFGAESLNFNDSNWRKIDIPHDWSIENIPNTSSPFSPNAVSSVSGGFTVGGTGIYRKTFQVSDDGFNDKILLQFDGVYMNSEVWINGVLIGKHPYGYTSFVYDITDKIKRNSKNVCVVKVMNEGENSRWYSGSGIYRHVWLIQKANVHIAPWGTKITTPSISLSKGIVQTTTRLINQNDYTKKIVIKTSIEDFEGKILNSAEKNIEIKAKDTLDIESKNQVLSPKLWSVDSPILYRLRTEILSDNKVIETVTNKFGFRTIAFDVKTGFSLNGISMKLKGGCFHHDNGPLGAKAYDRAEFRKVELLKNNGYNAIRCSHNPPSEAFLNACDSLGMLVIDEAFDMWNDEKKPFDYHLYFSNWWKRDLTAMIERDRNHPSIILWSIGNEIPNMESPNVIGVSTMLKNLVHQLDPTRPVTAAVNGLSEKKDAFFSTLDIAGYNYASGGDHLINDIYAKDHIRVPERIMLGTESYPLESFASWMAVIDHPYLIGDFVWTAIDHIGEASIGWRGYWQEQDFYPWNISYSGDIDICGWKRPQSYYRDVLWKTNQVSLFVVAPKPSFPLNPARESWSKWHWHDYLSDWNWDGYENKPMEIVVFSSCEEVELFQNGKSLGIKKSDRNNEFTNKWQVNYSRGILKAVGYTNKKATQSYELKSASNPTNITLSADKYEMKADGQDLSYITVQLKDSQNNTNPKIDKLLQFEVEGPATIVGISNGNPTSVQSFQANQIFTWKGRCLLILKSKNVAGKITVKAKTENIKLGIIELSSK